MARCPLKGARKSVMCPLRNIFIILGNERLTEVAADIVPNGSPRYYIVPLGSFWSPWGIASHPRPQIGAFGILTILPSTGGAGTVKMFFPHNAPQLRRVGQGVLCGHKPRLEAPLSAIFCPLTRYFY